MDVLFIKIYIEMKLLSLSIISNSYEEDILLILTVFTI